ncbi:hypothetical protein Ciccas_005397 [Cichlidogyrus casuarinus]|uniref:Lebercilin domain-containing protein n=1 Tax=Cichlidogyrus casuarinus TaxID=1844966 RepID=A0ABD2Q9P1_9PLAT
MNNLKTGIYHGYPRQANEFWQNSLRKSSSFTRLNKVSSRPVTATCARPNILVQFEEMGRRVTSQEQEISKLQQELRDLVDSDQGNLQKLTTPFQRKDQARMMTSLKQQLFNLKQLMKDRDRELSALKTTQKFTDTAQLTSQLEASFSEIQRLRSLLKHEQALNENYARKLNSQVKRESNSSQDKQQVIQKLVQQVNDLDSLNSSLRQRNRQLEQNGDPVAEQPDLRGEFLPDSDTKKYLHENSKGKRKVAFAQVVKKPTAPAHKALEPENELKKALDEARALVHSKEMENKKLIEQVKSMRLKYSSAIKAHANTKTKLDQVQAESQTNKLQLDQAKQANELLAKRFKAAKTKLTRLEHGISARSKSPAQSVSSSHENLTRKSAISASSSHENFTRAKSPAQSVSSSHENLTRKSVISASSSHENLTRAKSPARSVISASSSQDNLKANKGGYTSISTGSSLEVLSGSEITKQLPVSKNVTFRQKSLTDLSSDEKSVESDQSVESYR